MCKHYRLNYYSAALDRTALSALAESRRGPLTATLVLVIINVSFGREAVEYQISND